MMQVRCRSGSGLVQGLGLAGSSNDMVVYLCFVSLADTVFVWKNLLRLDLCVTNMNIEYNCVGRKVTENI